MASGPRHGTNSPVSDSLSLRLRDFDPLASPHTATRRFILQKTRRNARAPRHLEGPRFQVLFHSPRRGSFHLSLTVLCAIGSRSYSALDRGRPGFGQGSSCPALLRHRTMERLRINVRGCHPLRRRCPAPSDSSVLVPPRDIPVRPYNPGLLRFGLLRVRSPLLAESLLISSPGLLRWFTSPGLAPPRYLLRARGAGIAPRGLPHSAVRGSRDMCSSPRLFAAYRGLHRHAAPQASAMDLPLA